MAFMATKCLYKIYPVIGANIVNMKADNNRIALTLNTI